MSGYLGKTAASRSGLRLLHKTLLTIMPWNKKEYPDSLKNFMAPVRNKAIDIANALLAKGTEEQHAIAIATAQAEDWAVKRGLKLRKDRAPETKGAERARREAKRP